MRIDKLTTKFQEALGEAQTLALGNDHAFIEPAHVLLAMLRQDEGPKALLQRSGVNVPALMSAAETAMNRLPQVQGCGVEADYPQLAGVALPVFSVDIGGGQGLGHLLLGLAQPGAFIAVIAFGQL